jgi:hypothetical protein
MPPAQGPSWDEPRPEPVEQLQSGPELPDSVNGHHSSGTERWSCIVTPDGVRNLRRLQ